MDRRPEPGDADDPPAGTPHPEESDDRAAGPADAGAPGVPRAEDPADAPDGPRPDRASERNQDVGEPAKPPSPGEAGPPAAAPAELPSYPGEARPPAAELPSYPGRPGPRAARRAAERERQRRMLEEEEGGLPTYPRARPGTRRYSVLDRLLILGLTLAAVLLIAYIVTQADRGPEPDNVLVQAVEAAGHAEVSLETNSSRRARQFVQDEFGWTVGVPVFPAAELVGVGIGALAPVIEVPVFFYRDNRGREAVLFSLNYALLDQVPDRVHLRHSDYERLADDPNPRTHRVGGRQVLLWRDRADIYVLVTDIPPDVMAFNIRVVR